MIATSLTLFLIAFVYANFLVIIAGLRREGASAPVTLLLIVAAAAFCSWPVPSVAADIMQATMAEAWPLAFFPTHAMATTGVALEGLGALNYAATKALPFARAAATPAPKKAKATGRRTLSYAWQAMEVDG